MGLIQRARLFWRTWKEITLPLLTEEILREMEEDGEIKQCFECGLWYLPETDHHHDFTI